MLGGDITVTVLGVEGDRVKLGIQAPRNVVVLRQELFEQVQSANSAAAASARPDVHTLAAALGRRVTHRRAGASPQGVSPE
jgi:carbon storage regulator